MKTILIVGGAGYIGSYVNLLLHRSGYDSVIYDNLSTGDRQHVLAGTFAEGDLADRDKLAELLASRPFDAVMHFAASIDAGASCHTPIDYYRNNVANTLNLIEALVKTNKTNESSIPLIFSSTAAVYGNPQRDTIDETHPKEPINPYGASKLMVEQVLRDAGNAHGLRSICLRYFNAAGGDPESELTNHKRVEHNLIPATLRAIKGKRALTVFGDDYDTPDGTCIRDYIHVHDLATAHVAAMERLLDGAESDVFNLGNGNGFSVREVIEAARKVTGEPLEVLEGKRRAGDPALLIADATKAAQALAWQPQYPGLEDIVTHAWRALP